MRETDAEFLRRLKQLDDGPRYWVRGTGRADARRYEEIDRERRHRRYAAILRGEKP